MLLSVILFFFFKQKTAYEMHISDWSSDVCSSDLTAAPWAGLTRDHAMLLRVVVGTAHVLAALSLYPLVRRHWQQPWAAVAAVAAYLMEIGRASCRERVCQYV